MPPTNATTVSRSDRVGIWFFLVAGVAIAVSAAVQATLRVVELLRPGAVPVHFDLAPETEVQLDYPGGSLAVDVESAVLHAEELPAASLVAGVASPIVWAVVTIAVTACLALLALSILRGQIFSRRNTALVVAAGLTGLVGFALARLFDTMLANGAVALATGGSLDHDAVTFSPFGFLLAGFAIAVISTVFTVGERLQRDTEGLV